MCAIGDSGLSPLAWVRGYRWMLNIDVQGSWRICGGGGGARSVGWK